MQKKKKTSLNSKAQVWVETVIYTLIGMSIIGIVLAIATPKINELKDKNILESSKNLLKELDTKINEVSLTPGNQKIVEIELKKGKLFLGMEKEEIFFFLDSDYKYSESDLEIKEGRIFIKTTGESPPYKVYFKTNYSSLNLTLNSLEKNEELVSSSKPYRIILLNKGNANIDFRIEK